MDVVVGVDVEADTDVNADVDTVEDEFTGFTFDGTDEGSLDVALNKAIDWHRTRASKWEEIAVSNMETDFGWSRSATMYLDLYRSL